MVSIQIQKRNILLEAITIFRFKKKQKYQTKTDVLIKQLRNIQFYIKDLEDKKRNFDTPRFLRQKDAENYVGNYTLFLLENVQQIFCVLHQFYQKRKTKFNI